MTPRTFLILAALLFCCPAVYAQTPPPVQTAKPADKPAQDEPSLDAPPVVTRHSAVIGGTTIHYTATTGLIPLKSRTGETEAHVFFVAYTRDDAGPASQRPLTFAFNGGPGSASIWLHIGALGPRRVHLQPDGTMPPPPFHMVDNESSWLDRSDLVFIDPVGTGYSRPAKPELGSKYWGLRGDIASVGEFIRLYLGRYNRWGSPLFLAGESYGTTRASGLSNYLLENGIALNGIVLVSSVLNFQTIDFNKGNEQPYVMFLPTYTASAWFHHRLAADLERNFDKTMAEAEQFATGEYAQALDKGDTLTAAERSHIADRLARYTGLDRKYLLDSDLRVEISHFCKELLRDQRRSVGRYDSRFKGIEPDAVSETPEFDPSYAAVRPPFTAAFNEYLRSELGYKTDTEYYVLGGGITAPWDWGSAGGGYPNVSDALRSAFAQNPYMKLYIACGYYDLATPFFAVQYTLAHLGLDPTVRKNVTLGYYQAGHMIYLDSTCLTQFKSDIGSFLTKATSGK